MMSMANAFDAISIAVSATNSGNASCRTGWETDWEVESGTG